MVAPLILPDGGILPVIVRSSRRARRIALRFRPADLKVEIVLPPGASLARAEAFLADRRDWLVGRAARIPQRIPFAEGAIVPLLGRPRILCRIPTGNRAFRIDEAAIEATGSADHFPRRIHDGLRRTARSVLDEKTRAAAASIGAKIGRIGIGDAKTRWGSCARSGNIRYSWRLIMAPEPVLDYVVAHEVGHLVEMNHSQRFWRLVGRLHPTVDQDRAWLLQNGSLLHRYG